MMPSGGSFFKGHAAAFPAPATDGQRGPSVKRPRRGFIPSSRHIPIFLQVHDPRLGLFYCLLDLPPFL
jgi:hypothetical protein